MNLSGLEYQNIWKPEVKTSGIQMSDIWILHVFDFQIAMGLACQIKYVPN
jgi:hypothetical protein